MSDLMILETFARLVGLSPQIVRKAIRQGRIKSARKEGRNYVIFDPDAARKELAKNTDLTRVPAEVLARHPAAQRRSEAKPPTTEEQPAGGEGLPSDLSASEASTAEKYWKSKLAELQYRERSGELVQASEVSSKLVSVFAACRTKLLGIPSRARQALPHLTLNDLAVIEGLVRESLEELAEGSA